MMDDDHAEFGSDASPVFSRRPGGDLTRPRQGEHRSGERGHHRGPRVHHERLSALVDARFWSWLHDDEEPGSTRLSAAIDELQALAQAHGVRLQRVLWFTDQETEGGVHGAQVRRVPSNSQDRGVTMLRAMARELQGMAEHRAVDRVLLVSDDDRLLLAVDDAQRRGLQVDMLVDPDSQDLKALQDDDPNWASLLQSADRLVVLGSAESGGRTQRPRAGQAEPRLRREAPSAEASGIIEDEILTWWDDETPDQREHWRQEVQASRGIPQELDRQLLLRISRRLGQPLSPAEKTAMRHQVRQQVLAQGDLPSPLMTTPADA